LHQSTISKLPTFSLGKKKSTHIQGVLEDLNPLLTIP